MAGSPGAGKTEYSKNLIASLENNQKHRVIRIDGDEYRDYFENYKGTNSYLFQGAISKIINKVHDIALENKQSFILDGTLSKYSQAAANIQRSLNKGREIRIFYVYQRPEVAWRFTLARETLEGRNIPKDVFIKHFLSSRKTIERIRAEFDSRVVIFLVKKDFENHKVEKVVEIMASGPSIEDYLDTSYTEDSIKSLL
jgi:UDP-N-acetylglucosamine kinase